MSDDLAFARHLVNIAAELSLPRFEDDAFEQSLKPDESIVTEVDKEIEVALRKLIAKYHRADGVIAEEFDLRRNPDSSRQWIIDPIDATRNFAAGNPEWATLIALVIDGVPQLGIVSAPALDRRWWAMNGGGAFTQDSDGRIREISVSEQSEISNAHFSHAPEEDWKSAGQSVQFTRLTDTVGSADMYASFYGQVLVAEGALDAGGLDPDARQWDIAALVPILKEVGGTFTDLAGHTHDDLTAPIEGTYSRSMLATNGCLLEPIAEIFRPATPTPDTPAISVGKAFSPHHKEARARSRQ